MGRTSPASSAYLAAGGGGSFHGEIGFIEQLSAIHPELTESLLVRGSYVPDGAIKSARPNDRSPLTGSTRDDRLRRGWQGGSMVAERGTEGEGVGCTRRCVGRRIFQRHARFHRRRRRTFGAPDDDDDDDDESSRVFYPVDSPSPAVITLIRRESIKDEFSRLPRLIS